MRDSVEHIGDLIVLGLPFKATEKEMREYFGQFGEITFVQVCTIHVENVCYCFVLDWLSST